MRLTKGVIVAVMIVALAAAVCLFLPKGKSAPGLSTSEALPAISVQLSETQLKSVKLEPALEREFALQREAVGSIDFNEDKSVPVFSPYQGKIIEAFAQIGDDVEKYQTLYTIESPDLIQAEATLISAAGTYALTTRALARARELYKTQGVAQKDLDQAVSDQQAADAALKAAKSAVHVFGKTDAEIGRILSGKKVDAVLIVQSPIAGRVTARNAAPGLLVQPGNPPAPYSVADVSTIWMNANVAESESP